MKWLDKVLRSWLVGAGRSLDGGAVSGVEYVSLWLWRLFMTRQELLVTVCVPTRHSSNYQEFPIYVGTPDLGYRTGPDRRPRKNRPGEQGSAQHHSLPTLVLTLCALGGSGRGGLIMPPRRRIPPDKPVGVGKPSGRQVDNDLHRRPLHRH